MKLKLIGATLAAIVLGYIAWGIYQNATKKPLPPPAPVVSAPVAEQKKSEPVSSPSPKSEPSTKSTDTTPQKK